MIDLKRYYDNVFFPIETTEGNFVEGTDRHIALLTTNNPGGIFDTIITAIKTRRDELKDLLSKRDSEGTEQTASTMEMNASLAEFQKFIRIREGLVKSTFNGDDTPQYEEFFPHGLTEYGQATLGTIETLMDRCVTKATKYEAELGLPFKTDCINLRDKFKLVRQEQLTNLAQSSTLTGQVQIAFEETAMQLTVNLLTTAAPNVGNPAAADNYFDQRFFLRPEQSGIYAGEGAVDQTKTIRSQGWTDTKSFKVYNKGTADFTVGFMNADGVPVAVGQAMAPGTNQTFTAAALGYNPVMHYLNISPAAATAAKWLVEML